MPLYSTITQDGTVLAETKAENCSRDYLNPHHRDEDAEELCPRSLPLVSEGSQDLPAEKKLLLPRSIVCCEADIPGKRRQTCSNSG
jgi:hypothetical protein